jgi:alpha-glucosidase
MKTILTLALMILGGFMKQNASAAVRELRFRSGPTTLLIEILDDKLMHFEVSQKGASTGPIYATPYVDSRVRYLGPSVFRQTGNEVETAALRIEVDPLSLSISAFDKVKGSFLTRISPMNMDRDWKGLMISKGQMTNAYGLGELFLPSRVGTANGDWIGEVRFPGGENGNAMTGFHGGYTGNAQFPVLYAVGEGANYALFLDQIYKQEWNFKLDPWTVHMWGDQVRGYLIAGGDLPELRTSFMKLVGRPLVPPKKAFGLWISEFGFDSWNEIRDKLRTLRANGFPIDGFVLDLQWFGGVNSSELSPMGRLSFDLRNFPNPAATVKQLLALEGIGLITIEESYISRGLPEHAKMETLGYMAKGSVNSNKAFFINENPWWGVGGMIDWSNFAGAEYWHKWKRQPLVEMGIMGHWTDLGEPEMYRNKENPSAIPYYHGFPEIGKDRQADIHNVFSLLWHKSIYEGYQANRETQRPWILSRSGGPGMQRYGAGMWSGDIGSNFGSLASQFNVQMHMSMSGIDYFGADIGGFHRSGMDQEPGTDLSELYTQWFANGAAFDVPVRPHTENVSNTKETAPDRAGDLASNLANIRLRYELSPYYYSLAHRAYLYGEPVVPPLVYYYQNAGTDRADFDVRTLGHEKLIGRDLLFAVVAGKGERSRDIYLPPGEWVDFYSNKRYPSIGQSLYGYSEYAGGVFRLPLFARAGAIIPLMFVDTKSMNIEGLRSDGSVRNELIARVYTGVIGTAYEFTVYEDDGRTDKYQKGEVAKTRIRQLKNRDEAIVYVDAAVGWFSGMPSSRNSVVELVALGAAPSGVRINGVALQKFYSAVEIESAASGWAFDSARGVVVAKSGVLPVRLAKTFIFRN